MGIREHAWKVPAFIAAAALVATLAMLIGTEVGRYVGARKLHARRAREVSSVLERMGTIHTGDTLPDHRFKDLNGNLVWYGELLQGHTIVSFFDPACEACRDELGNLLAAITRPEDARYILFICSGARDTLVLLARTHDLASQLLYDEGGAFRKRMGVFTFPFSIKVNAYREVLEISTDPITTHEFRDIIMESRKAEAGD